MEMSIASVPLTSSGGLEVVRQRLNSPPGLVFVIGKVQVVEVVVLKLYPGAVKKTIE